VTFDTIFVFGAILYFYFILEKNRRRNSPKGTNRNLDKTFCDWLYWFLRFSIFQSFGQKPHHSQIRADFTFYVSYFCTDTSSNLTKKTNNSLAVVDGSMYYLPRNLAGFLEKL